MSRIQQKHTGTRSKRVPMELADTRHALEDALSRRGMPSLRWSSRARPASPTPPTPPTRPTSSLL